MARRRRIAIGVLVALVTAAVLSVAVQTDVQAHTRDRQEHADLVTANRELAVSQLTLEQTTYVKLATANHREAFELTYKHSKYPPGVVQRLLKSRLTQQVHVMDEQGIQNLQHGADWLAEHKVLSGRLDIAQHSFRA